MPKRSNTFQRLVAAVHADIGAGWDVKESVFLKDSVTGGEREVDIVAKSIIGNYSMFISIECRDHGRPADVTWVEAMAKKHEHLPTSKLALWSRSGFSENAIVKAGALKIDVVSQDNTAGGHWSTLAQSLVDGQLKYITPQFKAFVDVETDDGTCRRFEPCEKLLLSKDHGIDKFAIIDLLNEIYANPQVRTTILDHAPEGEKDFYIEWKSPSPLLVWDIDQLLGKLRRLGIGLQTTTEMSLLEVRSVLNNGAVHTMATAKVSDGELDIYIKEEPHSPPLCSGKINCKTKNAASNSLK